jgi:hypothetical protein
LAAEAPERGPGASAAPSRPRHLLTEAGMGYRYQP